MKPIRQMTQAELAAFVQSHLRKNGVQVDNESLVQSTTFRAAVIITKIPILIVYLLF